MFQEFPSIGLDMVVLLSFISAPRPRFSPYVVNIMNYIYYQLFRLLYLHIKENFFCLTPLVFANSMSSQSFYMHFSSCENNRYIFSRHFLNYVICILSENVMSLIVT